ncbi:carbohydrate ABC transporter ATP-binding protein, CUT1 family [Thermanaeromonas toyohensis ToBE]|uniref:Carbohydrate ABC transporter ATP-binding protein, CUT1 family n=1 Tax=Thermanaeromonas toyohensis ToBE TaxID=698762 RepID=A0A1W1VVG7_9FIRM|nr:sn-glycerol-3-phosphate ABC transporter ATP-binding protein UgpC [Thermanaeromonas toyohensis]SMB97372.1 carbohydrate ABC transporter ATP-binding protein, CUT1 family [Thermanaeromonas toyohensis ToBE]
MASVILRNVWKKFGQVIAVRDFNLEIKDGEFIVLVGPSGCGKTTTLRMVAGLEDITQGEIYIGDRLVNDVPPKDRDIAMVFQNYALYPHMNVYDNMAFGLKMRKVPKQEIKRRVEEAAKLLGIEHLLTRKPKELSGGQRQRVALGRAIVREPKVFLMDEPLSNLDAKLRVQMRAELTKLQQKLGVTTIYVTHDQVEAMTMGHRIVVMRDGIIQQIDTPLGLYERPANLFVAGFIGSPPMNFLPVMLEEEQGVLRVKGEGFSFPLAEDMGRRLKAPRKEVVLGLRPEDITVEHRLREAHPEWVYRVKVEVVEPLGAEGLVYFSLGGQQVVARLSGSSLPKVGEEVALVFNLNRAHFFDKESGKAVA